MLGNYAPFKECALNSVPFNFNDEIFSKTHIEFALKKIKTGSRYIDSLLDIHE